MIYRKSESSIRFLKIYLVAIVVMVDMMFVIGGFYAGSRLRVEMPNAPIVPFFCGMFGGLAFLVMLMAYIGYRINAKRLRASRVEVTESGFSVNSSGDDQWVPFKDVNRMAVYSKPMIIKIETGNKRFMLAGYEDMEGLAASLVKNIVPELVELNAEKFNARKTIKGILLWLLVMTAYVFGNIYLHPIGMDAASLMMIAVGIYLVFFTPSNFPGSMRKVGWFAIVGGILLTVWSIPGNH